MDDSMVDLTIIEVFYKDEEPPPIVTKTQRLLSDNLWRLNPVQMMMKLKQKTSMMTLVNTFKDLCCLDSPVEVKKFYNNKVIEVLYTA